MESQDTKRIATRVCASYKGYVELGGRDIRLLRPPHHKRLYGVYEQPYPFVVNRLGRGYSFEALRAKLLFTEGLQKERRPKYQRRIEKYELEEYLPIFKMPPVIREQEEIALLGIDISTLIDKLEKGEL